MKISDIQRYDSSKMYEAYEKWSETADSYEITIAKIEAMQEKMQHLSKHMLDDDFNEDKF